MFIKSRILFIIPLLFLCVSTSTTCMNKKKRSIAPVSTAAASGAGVSNTLHTGATVNLKDLLDNTTPDNSRSLSNLLEERRASAPASPTITLQRTGKSQRELLRDISENNSQEQLVVDKGEEEEEKKESCCRRTMHALGGVGKGLVIAVAAGFLIGFLTGGGTGMAVGNKIGKDSCPPHSPDCNVCWESLQQCQNNATNAHIGWQTCNGSLVDAQANLQNCIDSFGGCSAGYAFCNNSLATSEAALQTCLSGWEACNSTLSTAQANLQVALGNLANKTAEYNALNATLTTMRENDNADWTLAYNCAVSGLNNCDAICESDLTTCLNSAPPGTLGLRRMLWCADDVPNCDNICVRDVVDCMTDGDITC